MKSFFALARTLYGLLITVGNSLQSPFLLAVRLYWGYQFFISGKGKLGNLDKVTGFFTDLHIPFPKQNAIMNASLECFGGLLLLVGLGSRLISIPLAITMVVAYLTADLDVVKGIYEDPDKFVTAAEFLFLFAV